MRSRGPWGLVLLVIPLLSSIPNVAITSPEFEFLNRYDDSPPRGNGNGEVEIEEELWHMIALLNLDVVTFDDVSATLRSLHGATILDDHSFFGSIPPGGTAIGDPFVFRVAPGVEPRDVLLEVTFHIPPFPPVATVIDVIPPGPPEHLTATASTSSITLAWDLPSAPDILGYDIFRSETPAGPFLRINESIFQGGMIFEDINLPPGTYHYHVATRDRSFNASHPSQIVAATTITTSLGGPSDIEPQIPSLRLLPSVPNPFISSTTVHFTVPADEAMKHRMSIAIYDVEGHLVRVLVDAPFAAGQWVINWDGRDSRGERLSGGAYFVELKGGTYRSHSKLVMIK